MNFNAIVQLKYIHTRRIPFKKMKEVPFGHKWPKAFLDTLEDESWLRGV